MPAATIPTHMTEKDYRVFKYLVDRRLEHILQGMAGVDIDLLISFLRGASQDKSNATALDQLEAVCTAIEGLVDKYDLGKLDIVDDITYEIKRKSDQPTITGDEIVAAQVEERLNGHTPMPAQSRAQRRNKGL